MSPNHFTSPLHSQNQSQLCLYHLHRLQSELLQQPCICSTSKLVPFKYSMSTTTRPSKQQSGCDSFHGTPGLLGVDPSPLKGFQGIIGPGPCPVYLSSPLHETSYYSLCHPLHAEHHDIPYLTDSAQSRPSSINKLPFLLHTLAGY